MSFNITLENATGMTHDEVGEITKKLEARGMDLDNIRELSFMRKEGWVGVIFGDGEEVVVEGILEPPGSKEAEARAWIMAPWSPTIRG